MKPNYLAGGTLGEYKGNIRVWFLTILPIGNLSFYINPECFLVPLNLNVSQLGLTLNLLIGCV